MEKKYFESFKRHVKYECGVKPDRCKVHKSSVYTDYLTCHFDISQGTIVFFE